MTTTVDAFLGGRLQIEQPASGYRAGLDPVILAAACPARAGERVLDLGCGVGTAALCVASRVDVSVAGVELLPNQADLAEANGQRNGIDLHVVLGDVTARPTPLSDQTFDHVITNPPFFVAAAGKPSNDITKATGRSGDADLRAWIGTAFKRLKHKGGLTLIQKMDRLPDVLDACTGFGDIQVLPLSSRAGRAPHLFVLRARKGTKAPFQMLHPMNLHEGQHHDGDKNSYTETINAVLRCGADLPWPKA